MEQKKETELEKSGKKEEALKKMRKNLDSKGQILLWEDEQLVCEKENSYKEQDDITALQENLKKAESANDCFLISPIIRKALPKKKLHAKLPLLQNPGPKKKVIYLYTIISRASKAEERKQAQSLSFEQKAKQSLEAKNLQKNEIYRKTVSIAQKKNREEITKKLLDAQKKMKALLQDIDAKKKCETAMQQKL